MSVDSGWSSGRLDDRFRDVARHLERVDKALDELYGDVRVVMPLVTQVGELEHDSGLVDELRISMAELRTEIKNLTKSIEALRIDQQAIAKGIEARDIVMVTERAASRRALYALVGTLATALIGGLVALVVAGVI